MTPAEYTARVKAWERQQERLDRRAALAPWVVANVNRSKNQPAYKITDFMPAKPAEESEKPKGIGKADQLRLLAALPGGMKLITKKPTAPDGKS